MQSQNNFTLLSFSKAQHDDLPKKFSIFTHSLIFVTILSINLLIVTVKLIMQYIQGLLGVIVCFLIIMYRRKLYEATGPIGFAEQYFMGTINFFVLASLAGIVISIMWFFGTIQQFIIEKGGQFL